jgi:hypothetical protein
MLPLFEKSSRSARVTGYFFHPSTPRRACRDALEEPHESSRHNWLFASLLVAVGAGAQTSRYGDQVAAIYPEVDALYLDLHQHPELSMHEEQTAAKMYISMRTGTILRSKPPGCLSHAAHSGPAMQAGLTGHVWTLAELIAE